jgi:hypothetical protein
MNLFQKAKAAIMHFMKNRHGCKLGMYDESVVEEQPLSTENITFSFCNINYLQDEAFISLVSDELKVPDDKVDIGIRRMIKDMRQDIICCIEYPYIDVYYRDTYYSFYSKKHCAYSRYCFRISFFSGDVNEHNFYDLDLSDKFYGYMVLRPTVRRVVGYTFLSPALFEEREFVCCLCKKDVSVYGRKLSVTGFPFCGQDGEAVSCAEISLMMMMDYFSHKYNKYSQLLPSQIIKILSRYSNERQLPSRGLPSDMISFVLRKIGFGIRTYTRQKEDADYEVYSNDEFKRLLYIYIESGFPIITCTSDHTYLVIGKENKIGEDNVKLVTINDNERPYKLIDYNEEITSFIVPLYEKIYLDAEMIQIGEVIKSLEEGISGLKIKKKDTKYIYRCFLTSSRSYKEYITQANKKDSREHFVCMAMPRFVWVCEMIDTKDVVIKDPKKTPVSNIMLFDATEGNASLNYFIMAKLSDRIIVRTVDNSQYHRKIYKQFMGNKDIFYTFDRNLKGEHTKWQD